jgi:hypothetical protein
MGFEEKAVPSPVPGWKMLMDRFESRQRGLDLASFEERQRLQREERRARLREPPDQT